MARKFEREIKRQAERLFGIKVTIECKRSGHLHLSVDGKFLCSASETPKNQDVSIRNIMRDIRRKLNADQ
jgi:hypothetical protein